MKSNAKETYELLRPVVDAIDRTLAITSVVEVTAAIAYDNSDLDNIIEAVDGVYKLYACNTLWLTIGSVVTIDAVDYTLTDIFCNEYALVTGASLPVKKNITIKAPYYFHGTIIAQSNELNQVLEAWNKLPMIYLHEITKETFDTSPDDNLDRTSDCDFYFMIDYDPIDWKTKEHYEKAIRPMRNLMFAFYTAMQTSKYIRDFGEFYQFDVYNYAKWGVYVSEKGSIKSFFKDNLSGCQAKMTIPFLDNIQDTCCFT